MCASRLINFTTFVLVLLLNVLFWTQTTINCVTNGRSESLGFISDMFTYMFSLLGILFMVTGIVMAVSLKKHYPEFYNEYGCLIWAATLCLALPLFMRGLNSYLYNTQKKYFHFYGNHFAFMNSTYVVMSSILPVVAQMMSLIFGAKQVQEKANKNKQNNLTFDSSSDSDGLNSSINSGGRRKNIFEPPIEKYRFTNRQALQPFTIMRVNHTDS